MKSLRAMSGIILAFLLAPAVIVTACSGKTSSTTGGGGGDDGGGSGGGEGGPAPNAPDCPTTEPAQGSPCNKDGLLCEYGDDFNPICNSIAVCSGTKWARPILGGGGGPDVCPSKPLPTSKPNPSDCAATRASVPTNTACSTQSVCAYDGSTCQCGAYCPSFPVGQPPCNPDAGVTMNCCDTSKIVWYCFDGPPYCPTPRPRIGSACAKDGDQCAVEPAQECGQAIMRCEKGVWTLPFNSCPVSTAKAKKDIAYLSPDDADRLHDEAMRVRLATYRYRTGDHDATHLGFIIEDMPPGSPAVMASREHVDLYGYSSMTIAALQAQERHIEALERRIAQLEAENRKKK
jgi:hypothetical protein